jgi:predicted transposase/invertase (TIGR01784 family)
LGYNVQIRQILESEANKETEDDKFNRVDILIENANQELIIIEIQSTQEYDYFHRILFGVFKSIAEHMKESDSYAQVKKVISVTIAYFDLGQGKDYVYHGTTQFKGLHLKDVLGLSPKQQKAYNKAQVYEIIYLQKYNLRRY